MSACHSNWLVECGVGWHSPSGVFSVYKWIEFLNKKAKNIYSLKAMPWMETENKGFCSCDVCFSFFGSVLPSVHDYSFK